MTPLIITFIILGFLSMVVFITLMILFYTKEVRVHITERYIPWYVWSILVLSIILFITATIMITINYIKTKQNIGQKDFKMYYLQELV
jgi:hypothetical protein